MGLDDLCFGIIHVQIVVYIPKLTGRDLLIGVEENGKEEYISCYTILLAMAFGDCLQGCLTDDEFIYVAGGHVKLPLWQPLFDERCVNDVADVAAAKEEDVGVNSLGKILGETNSRAKTACVKRHGGFNKCLGIHFGDF